MQTVKLYPFQAEGVKILNNKFDGRAILADELGLGKTLSSLYYSWKYLPDDPPGPVIVIVPAHLKTHWQREAERYLGVHAEVLHGRTCPAQRLPPWDRNQTYIINYEILVPPHWRGRSALPPDSWTKYLVDLRPRLVIADEGHKLKNVRAACTRAARRLFRAAPRGLCLTGTPLANRPADLWSLINLVRPDLYPSQQEFLQTYTYAVRMWYGWEYRGAKDLPRLHADLLESCMLRRRKEDVLAQLPPVQQTPVFLDVDLSEYRAAERDFFKWLESKSPGASLAAARAEAITKMTALKRLAAEAKAPAVVEWSEDLLEETGGKLLLGAIHHSVTDILMKGFGRKAVLVDGRLSSKEKQAAFDKFNLDPNCRILVGNIDAAGTGWSCKATADIALAEMSWRPIDVEQFLGRCHGLNRGIEGQTTHARFLLAAGTIDESICATLGVKSKWGAEAVDGHADYSTLTVHDQVREILRNLAATG